MIGLMAGIFVLCCALLMVVAIGAGTFLAFLWEVVVAPSVRCIINAAAWARFTVSLVLWFLEKRIR